MASRPGGAGGLGRGGRGAALLQLINQPVRNPGDAASGSSQQPAGAFGTVQQSTGSASGEPPFPGQVHSAALATVPQPVSGPTAAARLPQAVTQGHVESTGQSAVMGRGAMLQKLYDTQIAQQQPASVSATPSEASLESG